MPTSDILIQVKNITSNRGVSVNGRILSPEKTTTFEVAECTPALSIYLFSNLSDYISVFACRNIADKNKHKVKSAEELLGIAKGKISIDGTTAKEAKATEDVKATEAEDAEAKAVKDAEAKAAKDAKDAEVKAAKDAKDAEVKAAKAAKDAEAKAVKDAKDAEAKATKEAKAAKTKATKEAEVTKKRK